MNFNSQKKLIKKLKEKGKNPLLFLPCLIIRLTVTAFTALICTVDMALSDKNGNFLGIKAKEKKKRTYEKEMAEMSVCTEPAPEAKHGRPIRRPFYLRACAFILAFAFAFMIIPEADIMALSVFPSAYSYRQPAVEKITSSSYTGSAPLSTLSAIDLCDGYDNTTLNPNGYSVKIQGGTFNNMPYLTSVFLYYTSDTVINDNFSGISPDAAVFVKSGISTAVSDVRSQLGTSAAGITVFNDPMGTIRSQIPDPPLGMTVDAMSGVGCVTLEWDYTNLADGYGIYRINENPDGSVKNITKIGDYSNAQYSFPNASGRCTADITGSTSKCYYSVRPYVNVNDGSGTLKLYSTKHYISTAAAVSRQIGNPPVMTHNVKDLTVTLSITNLDTNADYAKIFYKDERDGMDYFRFVHEFDITASAMSFTDPNPLSSYARDYTVVQYYDINNSHRANNDRPLSNVNEPHYATVEAQTVRVIVSPQIADPTDFKAVFDNNELHFTWRAPDSNFIPTSVNPSGRYDIRYRIFINGELKYKDIPTAYYNISSLIDSDIMNGETITAAVQAYAIDTYSGNAEVASSNRVSYTINANTPVITSLTAGDQSFTVTWRQFNSSTSYYTVYWRPKGSTSFNSVTTTALTYTVSNLVNNTEYEVRIAADNSPTASAIQTVTPNNAPPAPTNLRIVACDDGTVTLKWDAVMENGMKYLINVKNGAGTIVATTTNYADNILKINGLINNKEYLFEVFSLRNGSPSLDCAKVSGWSAPAVDDIANLSVVPKAPSSLVISWLPAANANKYYLNRTDPYGNVEVFDVQQATSYEDKSVKNDVEYSYTVTTELIVGGIPFHKVSGAKKGKLSLYIGTVENLAAKSGDGIITLSWDPTLNADGYYVEYSTNLGSSWTQVGKVNTNSFVHTGLVNGTELRYRVRAYRVVNNEEIFSAYVPMTITARVGNNLAAPADFTATPSDGSVTLKWKAVSGASGYNIYVIDANGVEQLIDKTSKTTAVHNNLPNGTTLTYAVRAYRLTSTGSEEPGDFSIHKTVTVGTYLNAPTDIAATPGDSQVTLKWKRSDGAEGYVVYLFDNGMNTFTPIGIVTSTNYTHSGLTNGRSYTYMVAAYKTVSGEIKYSDYSITVTAVPMGKTTGNTPSGGNNSGGNNQGGSNNNSIIVPSDNFSLYITGTTPYGMSNSNLITASSEKGAINQDTDVRFTLDGSTVAAVQNVLDYYGEGLSSFLIYPMDISLYERGTDKKVNVNPGYYITMTIPVPDQLLPYSDYISVVHISDNNQLEILPSTHVNVGGVDCMQFSATSFSPYAFVVYKNDTAENISSGSFTAEASSMGSEIASSPAFLCTYLPELYRKRARNKIYRIKK